MVVTAADERDWTMKQPVVWKLMAAANALDREHLRDLAQLVHEAARRDWSIRVLDAADELWGMARVTPGGHSVMASLPGKKRVNFKSQPTPEGARLACAEKVWPDLPESVRQE